MLPFVYRTLTDPARADAVLADWDPLGPATLAGLGRVDGRYPTLSPGGTTPGRLLAVDDVSRLDAYERVDDGLYVRVAVPVVAGDEPTGHEAAVYVGDPARLGADAAWPGEGPFPARVRHLVAEREVVVRVDGAVGDRLP